MPLLDHFHPPFDRRRSWEAVHGQWPAMIVQLLGARLPPNYIAQPRVRVGGRIEIDVASFEREGAAANEAVSRGTEVAIAVWAPPKPTATFKADFDDLDAYEVQVFDAEQDFRLVAAIELVSPSNKDRPQHRRAFSIKCANYLQEGVSLVIVDVVTDRHFNLFVEMARLLGQDEALGEEPPDLYAVACRLIGDGNGGNVESWTERLAVGSPLPTVPLWIAPGRAILLELEASYVETCRALRVA